MWNCNLRSYKDNKLASKHTPLYTLWHLIFCILTRQKQIPRKQDEFPRRGQLNVGLGIGRWTPGDRPQSRSSVCENSLLCLIGTHTFRAEDRTPSQGFWETRRRKKSTSLLRIRVISKKHLWAYLRGTLLQRNSNKRVTCAWIGRDVCGKRGVRQNDPQHGFPKSVYAVVTYARRKPSCARLVW